MRDRTVDKVSHNSTHSMKYDVSLYQSDSFIIMNLKFDEEQKRFIENYSEEQFQS